MSWGRHALRHLDSATVGPASVKRYPFSLGSCGSATYAADRTPCTKTVVYSLGVGSTGFCLGVAEGGVGINFCHSCPATHFVFSIHWNPQSAISPLLSASFPRRFDGLCFGWIIPRHASETLALRVRWRVNTNLIGEVHVLVDHAVNYSPPEFRGPFLGRQLVRSVAADAPTPLQNV